MTEYALVTFQHNPIQKKCFWRSVFPKPRFCHRRILNLGPPATFSVDTILIVDKLLSFYELFQSWIQTEVTGGEVWLLWRMIEHFRWHSVLVMMC